MLVDVLSVDAYLKLERNSVVSPIPCPDGCEGGWGRHSVFQRQWVDYDCISYTITIVRVRCRGRCGAVWSLFPAFVWYRFTFCHRLVQSSCRELASRKAASVAEGLREGLPSLVNEHRTRVPAESTIRSWVKWLGHRCLKSHLGWALSLIARRDPETAREARCALEIPSGLTLWAESLKRTAAMLRICAVLDAVEKCRTKIFRSAPNQFRDLTRALFRERREMLARPP